jgi:hypothetical protein
MAYKVRQKQRDYQREWCRRKRKNEPTRIVNKIAKTKEERYAQSNKWRKIKRQQDKLRIGELIGYGCIFCGTKKNPQTHKTDGKKHGFSNHVTLQDVIDNPKDFVRLCHTCHRSVHWVMKYCNMTWKDILSRIEKI